MPLSIDIFNKKVLSSQSRFGTYNLLLSGEISYPIQLQTSNSTVNIEADLSNTFYGEVTGSKTFTYTNFQTGQYINLYLKANHTGNGIEHTFPSGTLFDKFGVENKIYTHSGYITKIELTNNPYGYLGNSSLIKYDYPSTGTPTGTQTDPYSDYVTLLMHFNTTGIDPIPTGALAFWKLDDVTDSINGNTLTNNDGVQFVAGKIGNCAQFDMSNTLSNSTLSPQFNPYGSTGEFTISIWVNPNSFSNYQAFIGGPQASTFTIHTDEDGGLNCNEAEAGDAYVATGLSTGIWQHIVFIKSLDGNSKIWLNGTNVYNNTTNNPQNYHPTSGVTLGALYTNTYPYNGKLDMVGLWNRELTEQEIQQLYNGGDGLEP